MVQFPKNKAGAHHVVYTRILTSEIQTSLYLKVYAPEDGQIQLHFTIVVHCTLNDLAAKETAKQDHNDYHSGWTSC